MKSMKDNFNIGILLAILFTCLQSYGLYKYGAAVTNNHPIGFTLFIDLMFFVGWVFVCACVTSVIRFVYHLIVYVVQPKEDVEQSQIVEACYDEIYQDEDEQLYTVYFDKKDRDKVEKILHDYGFEDINIDEA